MAGKPEKEKVWRTGVIPYYIENNQINMMFMRPTIHPNTSFMIGKEGFQIAKGRIDDTDLSTRDAALREAKEELGLWEGNILQLHEVGTFLGRTVVYVAEIEDQTLFSTPDSYETDETRWMSLEEFEGEGRKLHIPVVDASHIFIQRLHGLIDETMEQPIEEQSIIEQIKAESEADYDEFENPLATDRWGNRLTTNRRRRR